MITRDELHAIARKRLAALPASTRESVERHRARAAAIVRAQNAKLGDVILFIDGGADDGTVLSLAAALKLLRKTHPDARGAMCLPFRPCSACVMRKMLVGGATARGALGVVAVVSAGGTSRENSWWEMGFVEARP